VPNREDGKRQRHRGRANTRREEFAPNVLREEAIDDEIERLERSCRTGDQDRPALPGGHRHMADRKRIIEHVTPSNPLAGTVPVPERFRPAKCG
jgi:hypothetical protein